MATRVNHGRLTKIIYLLRPQNLTHQLDINLVLAAHNDVSITSRLAKNI